MQDSKRSNLCVVMDVQRCLDLTLQFGEPTWMIGWWAVVDVRGATGEIHLICAIVSFRDEGIGNGTYQMFL